MLFPQRTGGLGPVWRYGGWLGLAWLALGGGLAHADECSAYEIADLQQCINSGKFVVEWRGEYPSEDDGHGEVDLKGNNVELVAGARPLPLMRVYGGGELNIQGGRVVTPTAGLPEPDSSPDCLQMSNFYIRVYGGGTQVVLDGTLIEVDPVGDSASSYPTTVIEVRPGLAFGGEDTDGGASVELHQVVARKQTPLPHALVLTGYDSDAVYRDSGDDSGVTLTESLLFVDAGAVLHDDIWFGEAPANAETRVDIILSSVQPSWRGSDPANAAVGLQSPSSVVNPASLAFARALGHLTIKSSRFSRLRTRNSPLFYADELILDGVMVDDLEDIEGSAPNGNRVLLGDGRNVFVKSSLMCDLRGTESAFRGWYGDGKTGSVYVVNSALWQTELSLFELRQHEYGNPDGSGLVAANLTLHRSSASGRQRLVAFQDDAFPNLVLLNNYLQGPWELNDEDGRARVEHTVAGNVDNGEVCGVRWNDGCTITPDALLMPVFADTNCSDVMDSFESPLREVYEYTLGVDQGQHTMVRTIRAGLLTEPIGNLSAALFTAEERPALPMVDETTDGVSWRFPSEYGEWVDTEIVCQSSAEGAAPRIGAWSAEPNDSCSLTLLVPYGTEEQVEPNPPDGLFDGDEAIYGFAPGCRYSGAAVVLFLPLGLRRRREQAAG